MRSIAMSLCVLAAVAATVTARAADTMGGTDTIMKLKPFSLADVRLLDGRFKIEQERMRQYLHALDNDRLLYCFRAQAGLPTPGEPYGGWEAPTCEVRGHFVGHYLSACALMYASTGDTALKEKADALVADLAKCQQAMGGEYLSAFPEEFFDRLEAGRPVWVPYYTWHKILAGLYDMHTLAGNGQARAVMEGMAAYVKRRVDPLAPDQWDRVLRVEFGGMSEVLHNLYTLTGKPEHLAVAHAFDQAEFLGPLALGHDNLTRIHGNTNIPKVVGAARRYEITGDTIYRDLAMFFWDRVVNTRTYATGGSTMFESWPEPCKLAHTLGHLNHETCKTYNILRLTRHILAWTGEARYGDFYERALFNGILGTQGPEPGQLEYYVPMAQGYPRHFGTPDTAFWCCYGTGVESFSKIGDSIYFHDGTNLFVNLFVASRLDWKDKGVSLEQQTAFPGSDTTRLVVHPGAPLRFAINLRIPAWVAGAPEIAVNGEALAGDAKPGSWFAIDREWRDGDALQVRFPMNLHTVPLPDDPDQVAVLYGPTVLAGVLQEAAPLVEGTADVLGLCENTAKPVYFTGNPQAPAEWLARVEGRLAFQGVNQERPVTLVPFDSVVGEHYGLYWPVVAKGTPRYEQLRLEAESRDREIDRVAIFTRETGSERNHNFQGEKTASGAVPSMAYCYRHAEPGGWFSWEFKLPADKPADLLCSYWGSDVGRTFDVLVDEHLVATESLKPIHPGCVYDVVYPIPPELTAGKEKVTVKFLANHGTMAGGVFGCGMLRKK